MVLLGSSGDQLPGIIADFRREKALLKVNLLHAPAAFLAARNGHEVHAESATDGADDSELLLREAVTYHPDGWNEVRVAGNEESAVIVADRTGVSMLRRRRSREPPPDHRQAETRRSRIVCGDSPISDGEHRGHRWRGTG